jgi:Ice-binding-like
MTDVVSGNCVAGNIGLSPAAGTFLTGFSTVLDSSGTFSTSSQVTGKLFAASYASPTPSMLTTAVLDMQTAYTDASGRTLPDFLNLGSGKLI